MKNTTGFLALLFVAFGATAQDQPASEHAHRSHFEIAVRTAAGYNCPFANRGHDHYTVEIAKRKGTFWSAGVHAGLAWKHFSLVLESNYAQSKYRMDYHHTLDEKTGGYSSLGDYDLVVGKTEFMLYPRLAIGARGLFSLYIGPHAYIEHSKIATGEYHYSDQWYNPNSGYPYTPYTTSEDVVFRNTEFSTGGRVGIMTGVGYQVPLKNGSSLLIDLRVKAYKVNQELHDESFRFFEPGLSLGYTFYSGKR